MRICASHHQYETYRNKIDELRFPSNTMNSVLNFLQNHQEHRIIIEVKIHKKALECAFFYYL